MVDGLFNINVAKEHSNRIEAFILARNSFKLNTLMETQNATRSCIDLTSTNSLHNMMAEPPTVYHSNCKLKICKCRVHCVCI